MKTRSLLLILFTLFCNTYVFAQRENVWIMTNHVRIDFNNGSLPPTASSVNVFSNGSGLEANASVCDTNGHFLFYTDGNKVWDQNYNTMQNGQYLVSSSSPYMTSSSTQGALIVPMPDSAHKYYIFSLTSSTGGCPPEMAGRLYYSVVDMSLNNGLGAVVAGEKGIFVDSNLVEKMISIVGDHCNIWVLTCGRDGRFKAFEITSAGVQVKPVVSATGVGGRANPGGMIAVSRDRKHVAATQWGKLNDPIRLALFDFNPATGLMSNPIILSNVTSYGVCFSPDGSKLYHANTSQLYQLDLSAGGVAQIINSQTYIGPAAGMGNPGALKLGPDDKIYLATNNSMGLGVIEFPNRAGTACQFNPNALQFSGYAANLPNAVSVLKRTDRQAMHSLVRCFTPWGSSITLTPTDTSGWGYTWGDSSEGTNLSVNATGRYWVQYHTSPCVLHTDTFNVMVGHLPHVAIQVDTFVLSTTFSYDTYQWYLNGNIIPGATKSTYTVTKNGDYTVVVSDKESGCMDTSAIYEVTNVTGIPVNSLRAEIKVYPNPATDVIQIQSPVKIDVNITGLEGKMIKKVRHAKAINVKDLAEGIYFLQIYDQEGSLLKTEKIIKTL